MSVAAFIIHSQQLTLADLTLCKYFTPTAFQGSHLPDIHFFKTNLIGFATTKQYQFYAYQVFVLFYNWCVI
jgi:hypothetical protein